LLQRWPQDGFDFLDGHVAILGNVAHVESAAKEGRHLQKPECLVERGRGVSHVCVCGWVKKWTEPIKGELTFGGSFRRSCAMNSTTLSV
jgi:hypothetical protein